MACAEKHGKCCSDGFLALNRRRFRRLPALFFVLDKGKSIITWADGRKWKIEEGGRYEKETFILLIFAGLLLFVSNEAFSRGFRDVYKFKSSTELSTVQAHLMPGQAGMDTPGVHHHITIRRIWCVADVFLTS